MTEIGKSLQETFAPEGRCFGCGPANEKGLRIRSLSVGDEAEAEVVADWQPQPHHEAFESVLNGGIIGTLLDCHSNWTAARYFMVRDGLARPPSTVTADFHVRLKRPTPSRNPVRLSARVVEGSGNRATVRAILHAGDQITAECTGCFVSVAPDHPAYGRW